MQKKKKRAQDRKISEKAQMEKVRKESNNMEGKLRGAMLGNTGCPKEGVDWISGSLTGSFFIGAFYGIEVHLTMFFDNIEDKIEYTGSEIGYTNVFGRSGVEVTGTASISLTYVMYT